MRAVSDIAALGTSSMVTGQKRELPDSATGQCATIPAGTSNFFFAKMCAVDAYRNRRLRTVLVHLDHGAKGVFTVSQ